MVKLRRSAGFAQAPSLTNYSPKRNRRRYPVPTVRFNGERSEGFRAYAIVMEHALPIAELRRVWQIEDGEPAGPFWEIVLVTPPACSG
jgi:hypothetical protein